MNKYNNYCLQNEIHVLAKAVTISKGKKAEHLLCMCMKKATPAVKNSFSVFVGRW